MSYLPGEILFGYAAELDEKSRTVSKTELPTLDDYDHDGRIVFFPHTTEGWRNQWGERRWDFPTNRIEERDLNQYNHEAGGEIRGRSDDVRKLGGGDRETPGSNGGKP